MQTLYLLIEIDGIMRFILFIILLLSVVACTPKQEAITPVDQLIRDYKVDPSPERAEIYLDSLASYIGQHSDEKEMILPYLESGVDVSMKEGKLSKTPGFLLPLLRNYPELSNKKKYLIALGDVLYALRKSHASDVVYQDLQILYPNDADVQEKLGLLTEQAKTEGDYLTYLFDQLTVEPLDLGINRAAALKYVDAVEAKALISPSDASVPGHLYGAAEVARSMRTFPKAMSLYDWLLEAYPNNEKAPNVLFIKGFILEQDFKDEANARINYEAFLSKYPDHQMAESARFLLNNLGKTDEEILAEIEKNKQGK